MKKRGKIKKHARLGSARYAALFGLAIGLVMVAIGIAQIFAAQVAFRLSPGNQTAKPGQNRTINIRLHTSEQEVSGGKVRVVFDNSLLSFVRYNPPNPTQKTDIERQQTGSNSYTFEFDTNIIYDDDPIIDLGSIVLRAKNTTGTKAAQVRFDAGSTNAYDGLVRRDYYPVSVNSVAISVQGTQTPPPSPPPSNPPPSNPKPTPPPSNPPPANNAPPSATPGTTNRQADPSPSRNQDTDSQAQPPEETLVENPEATPEETPEAVTEEPAVEIEADPESRLSSLALISAGALVIITCIYVFFRRMRGVQPTGLPLGSAAPALALQAAGSANTDAPTPPAAEPPDEQPQPAADTKEPMPPAQPESNDLAGEQNQQPEPEQQPPPPPQKPEVPEPVPGQIPEPEPEPQPQQAPNPEAMPVQPAELQSEPEFQHPPVEHERLAYPQPGTPELPPDMFELAEQHPESYGSQSLYNEEAQQTPPSDEPDKPSE